MNNQDILKSSGSRLDIRLDNSENHDYELSHNNWDYDKSVIDFCNTITYDSLKINTTLSGCTNVKLTITLTEYDAPISGYTFSNLSFVFDYDEFVNYFSNINFDYSDLILNNDVFTYNGIINEVHYFNISAFNETLVSGSTISDFSTTILPGICSLDNTCCVQDPILGVKPWSYQINHGRGTDNCDFIVDRRPEKGWTIDLVFNKLGLPWSDGGVFYYLGVKGETDEFLYGDNNLSFKFSNTGEIVWEVIRYNSKFENITTTEIVNDVEVQVTNCVDVGEFVTSSGSTIPLCHDCTTNDFNITITFDRNVRLTDCSIPNVGGWNDLIVDETITNSRTVIELQEDPTILLTERLNKKWDDEQYGRLGTLKIYLNGSPIYKLLNWEEVIPSTRGFQPFIQQWGGGVNGYGNIHKGDNNFSLMGIRYYDEPLNFAQIYHHFITEINPFYNISSPNIDVLAPIDGGLVQYADILNGLWVNGCPPQYEINNGFSPIYNEVLDAGVGETVIVETPILNYRSAEFYYTIYTGTNIRAGIIIAVWYNDVVEYYDTSTNDIGNTSDVNLIVEMNGLNVNLISVIGSGVWTIKVFTKMI